MELISQQEFSTAIRLDKLKWNFLVPFLMRHLKLVEVNDLFRETAHMEGIPFLDAVLKQLGITYEVDAAELKHIPVKGGFLAIANHPYGVLDGLLMLRLLAEVRPDTKIMANQVLLKLQNLHESLIPVDPFKSESGKNIPGLRKALEHLHNDMPLGIFPAGEVSSYSLGQGQVTDPVWKDAVRRLIGHAKVPVVPIHFSGANSLSFQLLGLLHGSLRTFRLPAELFNKKGMEVKIRIGRAIPYADLLQLSKPEVLPYLRAHTYAMASQSPEDSGLEQLFKLVRHPAGIIAELHHTAIEAELQNLKSACRLFRQDQFEVCLVRQEEAPNVVREIGRLREITFRAVGEGTGKETDLDWYDGHYRHLFVYDWEARLLVGAYRIGKGRELYKKFGKKGFYLHSLFKMRDPFVPVLKQSLELGRSFVRTEYQKKALPLLLLWKGISVYLEDKPNYRYLIGPVSISNYFSAFSKALIVDFILDNFYDRELACHIRRRKKFCYHLSSQTSQTILRQSLKTISSLDDLVAHIETSQSGIPVLLKKYLKQNAKIIGFNLDPKFSNALDGFMIMEVKDLPDTTRKMLERLNKGA
jgi:putative hemolysin